MGALGEVNYFLLYCIVFYHTQSHCFRAILRVQVSMSYGQVSKDPRQLDLRSVSVLHGFCVGFCVVFCLVFCVGFCVGFCVEICVGSSLEQYKPLRILSYIVMCAWPFHHICKRLNFCLFYDYLVVSDEKFNILKDKRLYCGFFLAQESGK